MNILVMSRLMIESGHAILDEPNIIISITDPDNYPARIPFDKYNNCKDILRLQFWDLSPSAAKYTFTSLKDVPEDSKELFTTEQALEIWDFVQKYKKEVTTIICQCEAGISRSAGVAAALSVGFDQSDEYFFKNYRPNSYVYSTLLKVIKNIPICSQCKNEIDPDLCWCGSLIKTHTYGDGHSPVPMGCTCGYAKEK